MVEEYRPEFPDVPQLDVGEFLALRDTEDVVLVDVREPKERAVSAIPGSISLKEFESDEESFRNKRVVTYCTIGYRSSAYAEKLIDEGFDASNLAGSILAWVDAGQPVEDPEGHITMRVHTYGRRWAVLPDGYEAVY
jgi:rhodanese-related sulfurtransferase